MVVVSLSIMFFASAQPLTKPHLVIVSAEDEYQTEKTLPAFAKSHLAKYQTTLVTADAKNKNHLPEIGQLKSADVAIFSVRRRPLVEADLKVIKEFIAAKKPIVAIRTTSHAFAPKKGEKLPAGVVSWDNFDEEILGCKYTGHYPNTKKTNLTLADSGKDHPVLKGVNVKAFVSPCWLYKSSPLANDCTLLFNGQVDINPIEPAAWVRDASAKHGRVFYTCLGHMGDFELAEFKTMLANAVEWVQGK